MGLESNDDVVCREHEASGTEEGEVIEPEEDAGVDEEGARTCTAFSFISCIANRTKCTHHVQG
jgi:hypothetical protein